MSLSYNEAESRQMVMEEEVHLPSDVFCYKVPVCKSPESVLLTGGTGFLGAYLLYEWLSRGTGTITCLVRAKTTSEARSRLLTNLETYLLDTNAIDLTRVQVVLGDISQPRFGLSEDAYVSLADSVDSIIHSAATVMYFRPYEAVKPVNVNGTVEVLRLATTGVPKHVHYVSSYSVARSSEYAGPEAFPEEPLSGSGSGFVLGYVQSKWVAERLCQQARERNIPVTVHRPGIITGDMCHGIMKDEDFVIRAIQTCIRLGICPQSETWVHFTPVDFCAKAIVHSLLSENTDGHVNHLVNPMPLTWNELMKRMEAVSKPLEWMSPNQWWVTLSNTIRSENFLAPVFMIDKGMRGRAAHWQRWSIMDKTFDTQQTEERLKGTDIQCPPVHDEMITLYFRSLVRDVSTLDVDEH